MSIVIQKNQILLGKGDIHRDYLPVGPDGKSSRLFELQVEEVKGDSARVQLSTGSVFFTAYKHEKDGLGLQEVHFTKSANNSPRVFPVQLKIGDFIIIEKSPEPPATLGNTGIPVFEQSLLEPETTTEQVIEYDLTAIKGGRAVFEVKHRGFTCD